MSVKKLLGLESFPISEREVIRRIKEAQKKQHTEVVFSFSKKKVTLKLSPVDSVGLMNDYEEYYGK